MSLMDSFDGKAVEISCALTCEGSMSRVVSQIRFMKD